MVLVWKMDLSCTRKFFRRVVRALRYTVCKFAKKKLLTLNVRFNSYTFILSK